MSRWRTTGKPYLGSYTYFDAGGYGVFNSMLVLVEGAFCVLCGVAAAEHTYRTRDDTYAGADDR